MQGEGDQTAETLSLRCGAVSAGIVLLNAEGRIIYANPAACSILNLSPGEVTGSSFEEACRLAIREDGSPFPGGDHPARVTLRTGAPLRNVVMGLQAGSASPARWIRVDSEPVGDPAAAAVREVLVTFQDINRQRQAEEERRRESELGFAIIDTMASLVIVLDPEGRVERFNGACEQVTGYSFAEVAGRPFWDLLLLPEEADGVKAVFAELRGRVEAAAPWSSEHQNHWITRTGERRLIAWTNTVLFGPGGRVEHVIGIGVDITARKQAEDSLHRSEQFIRMIIDVAPARIAYADRSLNYRFVNQRHADWLGAPKEEIVGRPVARFISPASFQSVQPFLEQALAGREVRLDDFVMLHRGERRRLRLNYLPHFAEDRQVMGVLVVVEDITEQRQLEERLRQSQKMEAVGTLAGGVAHDFNNLLTVISGYSELLRESLGAESRLLPEVEEIQKAADRAASLTSQLLAYSRKQMLRPRPISLNAVVSGIEPMLRRLIGEHIALHLVLDPAARMVKADPGQVEQVILNLAVNARDAMPEGGRLTIETREVDLQQAEAGQLPLPASGRYVLLAVSDTGHGMDKETLAHLFEPFFTTKQMGRGTGLGLSTVYGIVRQSGGYIWAHSEPGMGATFRIYLPVLCEAPAETQPQPRPAGAAAGTETILLVEDEASLRRMVAEALGRCGYTVLQAGGGEEALSVARAHKGPLHLLVSDVVMPGMNGRDMARKLRRARPGLKCLFVSGYAQAGLQRPRPARSGTDFLQKPFTAEALARKVRQMLDG
ncbi:MAG: PAS domain-containing protein [Bryobacterales bacterium]|nr:PAS domain-containing protein [Bryobacterales bacterium]